VDALFGSVEGRKGADPASSYTATLFAVGTPLIARDIGEEAVETAVAALT